MKTISFSLKTALFLMVVSCGLFFAISVSNANAAMGDRSAAGSIPIAPGGEVTAPVNQEVKLNFGTRFDLYNKYYFIKIKPAKTGIITFKDDFSRGYSIVLCNAKKKIVSVGNNYSSVEDFLSWNSPYKEQTFINYGVKKGLTYYIRLKGGSTERADYQSSTPYIGTVKWTNKAIKPAKSGKSKKKAVKLKKGKKVKGLIVAGDKKGKWYKIKSKYHQTKIICSAKNCNGAIVADVMYKSGGKWQKTRCTGVRRSNPSGSVVIYSTTKKNTFYVKVHPEKKDSGVYYLSWRKN